MPKHLPKWERSCGAASAKEDRSSRSTAPERWGVVPEAPPQQNESVVAEETAHLDRAVVTKVPTQLGGRVVSRAPPHVYGGAVTEETAWLAGRVFSKKKCRFTLAETSQIHDPDGRARRFRTTPPRRVRISYRSASRIWALSP